MRSIFAMLIILSATFSAHASSSKQYEKCLEVDSSTMGMKMCAAEEIELQEARIKKALNKIIANQDSYKSDKSLSAEEKRESAIISKEIKSRLMKAQKAFDAYKLAQCNYDSADMLGGTGEGLILVSCIADMNSDRADALEKTLGEQK